MEKSCSNCVHHQGVKSIDDCPAVCYSCVGSSKDKPHFKPVEDKKD